MSIGVLHGQNGGAGLAVKVVGGAVKPVNPKEGTIWVNTDQEISAWSMRSTEPGSPVEGMVWLTINAETAVNALKKNEINIKPLRANQYIGGAWVLKPAELYRGGAWRALKTTPDFTYTGEYELVNDADDRITDAADGNWKIRFLTSGTLTFQALNGAENGIDVFLVGGGGGGSHGYYFAGDSSTSGGAGGGGGYTTTAKDVSVVTGTSYKIVIGAGGSDPSDGDHNGGTGGTSSAFGKSADGGTGGKSSSAAPTDGGSGGSGGGRCGNTEGDTAGNGGSDGADASDGGGKGQGTTTREFGESSKRLYAGGGAGNKGNKTGGTPGKGGGGAINAPGEANTGGGGGGGNNGAASGTCPGGSGIVVIRNKR